MVSGAILIQLDDYPKDLKEHKFEERLPLEVSVKLTRQ
jgi:hypothetical protein